MCIHVYFDFNILFSFFPYRAIANSQDPNTLDLHQLTVEEALTATKTFIANRQKARVKQVNIITGRGVHSNKGKAKIKPRILKYLKTNNFKYTSINDGCFKVKI